MLWPRQLKFQALIVFESFTWPRTHTHAEKGIGRRLLIVNIIDYAYSILAFSKMPYFHVAFSTLIVVMP